MISLNALAANVGVFHYTQMENTVKCGCQG